MSHEMLTWLYSQGQLLASVKFRNERAGWSAGTVPEEKVRNTIKKWRTGKNRITNYMPCGKALKTRDFSVQLVVKILLFCSMQYRTQYLAMPVGSIDSGIFGYWVFYCKPQLCTAYLKQWLLTVAAGVCYILFCWWYQVKFCVSQEPVCQHLS